MFNNYVKMEQSTRNISVHSYVLWIFGLPALMLVTYGLGKLDWPPGPLFVLHLVLQPLALLALFWLGAIGSGDLSLLALRLQLTSCERLLFSAALGLAVWWLGLLGLGLLGLFRGDIAWMLLFGLGLLGLWRFPAVISGLRFTWPRLKGWSFLLWTIILVSALYPLIAYGLLPPLEWDEIAYHLAIPKIYIGAGRIVNIPYIVHSNWPFGLEMIYTLALLLGPSGEVLAHLMHWSLALLTAAGLWYFSTQERQTGGLLAAAVFLSIPAIKELAGASMVDVGLAAYSWLAFVAWWRWRSQRDWRWLFLSGLLAGSAASLKLTGAAIVFLLSTMTLFVSSWARLKTRLTAAAAVGLIALIVVSPWFIKSWVFTGDPIYPFGFKFFPSAQWDILGDRYHYDYLHSINMPLTLTSYISGPVMLILFPQRFDNLSLGFILALLIPFGLISMRREKILPWLLFFIVGYYSIWFCLTHQIRFLVPMLPMAAFLAARGALWLMERLGSFGKVAVIVCLLLELPITQGVPRSTLLNRVPYLAGRQSRSELLAAAVKPFSAFDYVNCSLPKNARLLLATYEDRGYYLDRDYVWANMIGQRFLRFEQIPDGSALRQTLTTNGIDYLLDNRQEWDKTLTSIEHYDHLIRILDDLIAVYGEKLYSRDDITVYRLRQQENIHKNMN